MVKIISLHFILLLTNVCFASNDTLLFKSTSYFLRTNLHRGFIWAHSASAKHSENDLVLGLEFELLRKRNDTFDTHFNKKGFLTGFGINYFYFDNTILGDNINAFYTLESTFIKTKKLDLAFKANGGLNFVFNPYNKETNPLNSSYSTYINYYLGLGLVANFKLNDANEIGAKVILNHFSNGGNRNPNLGANFFTTNISYSRRIFDNVNKKLDFKKRNGLFESKNNWQIAAFATYKTSPFAKSDFFWVNGIGLSYNKPFGKKDAHSLALGLEVITDRAIEYFLIQDNKPNISHHRIGATIGHEFLFHRFTWGQYLGVYLFNEIPYFNWIYHRHTIAYKINKNWSMGVSLFANNQSANFTDYRVIYRWNREKQIKVE